MKSFLAKYKWQTACAIILMAFTICLHIKWPQFETTALIITGAVAGWFIGQRFAPAVVAAVTK
jgi:hypothetical protein